MENRSTIHTPLLQNSLSHCCFILRQCHLLLGLQLWGKTKTDVEALRCWKPYDAAFLYTLLGPEVNIEVTDSISGKLLSTGKLETQDIISSGTEQVQVFWNHSFAESSMCHRRNSTQPETPDWMRMTFPARLEPVARHRCCHFLVKAAVFFGKNRIPSSSYH